MRFEPIRPKRRVVERIKTSRIGAALRDFATAVVDRLSDYPPHGGGRYRRTGKLGRGWTPKGPEMRGQGLVVDVGTNVTYAPFVEGFRTKAPKQTKGAQRAGWPSIEQVAKEEWRSGRRRVVAALQGKR